MSQQLKYDRRRFLGTTAKSIVAAELTMIGLATPPPGETANSYLSPTGNIPGSSFGPIKQINAGVLNIGYAEEGPVNGQVVILMHGWPYDIHSFVDVTPLLVAKGYRVII